MSPHRVFILLVAIALGTGCGSSAWQRDSTARSVGCTPNEVKVTSKDSGAFDNIQSWYASCRGKQYRCVFVPGDQGGCYPATQSSG
ncbi:MAG: hypothetical protein FGM53_06985 [Rhodocyclaceae bacterium]|nr:hypothetical protein [Rhodocyclaceae bacterium]